MLRRDKIVSAEELSCFMRCQTSHADFHSVARGTGSGRVVHIMSDVGTGNKDMPLKTIQSIPEDIGAGGAQGREHPIQELTLVLESAIKRG